MEEAEKLIAIERQQARISPFAMEGTDPILRQRFLQLSQARELQLLETEMSPSQVKDSHIQPA